MHVCYAKIDKSRFIINPISTVQTAGTYGQVPLSNLRILDFENGNMNHASVSSCVYEKSLTECMHNAFR